MTVDLYRNRDHIPDFDAISAETAARSRALAARVALRRDLAYGPSARMRLDLLLPAHLSKGAPLHMFIHGGYWRSGSKEDHHLIAAPVLAVGGIAAIVTYELMPATRLAAIVGQVRQAAHYLCREAASLGADPQRFTASGHSAGAHLASYLAAQGPLDPTGLQLPQVRGLLLLSGLYDLSGIPDSFLRSEAQMSHAEAAAWSPLTARQQPGPTRVIAHGALETAPFHDQASRFAELLRGQGQAVDHLVEPAENHMSVVLALGDPLSRLGGRLARMVEDQPAGDL